MPSGWMSHGLQNQAGLARLCWVTQRSTLHGVPRCGPHGLVLYLPSPPGGRGFCLFAPFRSSRSCVRPKALRTQRACDLDAVHSLEPEGWIAFAICCRLLSPRRAEIGLVFPVALLSEAALGSGGPW